MLINTLRILGCSMGRIDLSMSLVVDEIKAVVRRTIFKNYFQVISI